jgi:peptide/nickel transport system substrate-binding protein
MQNREVTQMPRRNLASPLLVGLALTLVVMACAPSPSTAPRPAQPAAPQAQAAPEQPTTAPLSNRTLTMIMSTEPISASARPLAETFVSLLTVRQIFNASLAVRDERGLPRPRLAQALPQLNTDTWRVFPDGRMETTWKLKPNLVWHDGTPLTAEDFVFAWRLYTTPELGVAAALPINQMSEVVAPDPQTVVIRWRQLRSDADQLVPDAFGPLPRHIFEERFRSGEWEQITLHPYWKAGFVGMGPFRLTSWEPGAFLEGERFDRYVEGAPRIARIKIIFRSDINAALATFLSGEAQLSGDGVFTFLQEEVIRRELVATGRGNVLLHPAFWRMVRFQQRPDVVNPRAILDARIRKALAHAVDTDTLNESIWGGTALLSDTMIAKTDPYYPAIERMVTRYPFDLRRSEQLMADAGYRKGGDGFYASATDGKFSPDFRASAGQPDANAMANNWRTAGFDIQQSVQNPALGQDGEYRATFPALNHFNSFLGERGAYDFISREVARADNRWTGGNRGGWTDVEYDRLADTLSVTLDRNERGRLMGQMMQRWTEELPAIPMIFAVHVWAWVNDLTGPADAAPGYEVAWNVHSWELR